MEQNERSFFRVKFARKARRYQFEKERANEELGATIDFSHYWKSGPSLQPIMGRREKRAVRRRDYCAAAWYQFNQMRRIIRRVTGA